MVDVTYIGYHGTSKEAYAQIEENGFLYKKRKNHWLGQGVYFFYEDYEQAEWWAGQCRTVKYEQQSPCVLQAIIQVPHNRVLNTDTTPGRKKFNASLQEILKAISENNIEFNNVNKEYAKQCIICASFDNIKDVDVILKVFENSKKSYEWLEESAKFSKPTHTQICVRKISCIKELNLKEECS